MTAKFALSIILKLENYSLTQQSDNQQAEMMLYQAQSAVVVISALTSICWQLKAYHGHKQ